MLSKFRVTGLMWPTLFALAALGVLLALGTWQMSRKVWKDGLIAQIQAGIRAEPIPIDAGTTNATAKAAAEYSRVVARGWFQYENEQFLYAPDPRLGPGYLVVTPMTLGFHGSCPVSVLVNRGFVPETLKDPSTRAAGQINEQNPERWSHSSIGKTVVIGLVRYQQARTAFSPSNDPAKKLWFWRDLAGIAKSLGIASDRCPPQYNGGVLPFMIDAEAEPANPGGWPKGGTTNLNLPNKHLEYAVTWYGLALTLIGVYVAFAWGRLRGMR